MRVKIGDKNKERCNSCGKNISHTVINFIENIDEQSWGDLDVAWVDRYFVFQCNGCGRVKIKHDESFSEDIDEHGNLCIHTRYYPPAIFRKEPEWFQDLDPVWHISILMREIYTGLQNDCLTISTMGIRAALEAIMIEKTGDQGTFAGNLNAFQERGYISRIQRETLAGALEIGHASIHRGHIPSRIQVIFALDVIEAIIHNIYILDGKTQWVMREIPPRNPVRKEK